MVYTLLLMNREFFLKWVRIYILLTLALLTLGESGWRPNILAEERKTRLQKRGTPEGQCFSIRQSVPVRRLHWSRDFRCALCWRNLRSGATVQRPPLCAMLKESEIRGHAPETSAVCCAEGIWDQGPNCPQRSVWSILSHLRQACQNKNKNKKQPTSII